MAAASFVRTRPAVAALAAGLVVVVLSMVVPVSYERVTGHVVSLTLAGNRLDPSGVRAIAGDLKSRLHAGGVSVEAVETGAAPRFVLRVTTAERSRAQAARAAGELARELAGKGYAASVQVAPRRERVRYPVAAYAWDQIIQISVDGKSASQLESEIRDRLARAGVTDAQISVADAPGGGHEIKLTMERTRAGDPSTPPPEPPMPQLVLTKDGAPLGEGKGCTVRIERRTSDDGTTTLGVIVTSGEKRANIQVPNAQTLSDADLIQTISSRLREAGIEARVSVENGNLQIEQTP